MYKCIDLQQEAEEKRSFNNTKKYIDITENGIQLISKTINPCQGFYVPNKPPHFFKWLDSRIINTQKLEMYIFGCGKINFEN
jgi:hypothetical protein